MSTKNNKKSKAFFSDKGKKAFGDAVSTLIMFIAVISITTGLVIVFKNYVSSTQDSFSVQNKLTSNKLRSSITISNIYYNTSSNISYIYVKNIGEVPLSPKLFDVYMDNEYISNVSAYYATNLTKPLTILNNQETLVLIKQINLSTGTHEIKVVTEFSTSVKELFNT